jgi:mannan endo-1,4-beta-mannosidase
MRPTPPRARARARKATRSRALATGAIATIAATIGARAVDVDSYFSRSESSAFVRATRDASNGTFAVPFVRATSNGTFAVGCESRNVAGMNFYPLVEFAGEFARASFGFDHGDGRGRAAARDVFKLARESGMTTIRAWAFSVNPAVPTWVRVGERHREDVLRGLDWALAEAAKHGLDLLLAFGDYWHTTAEIVRECAPEDAETEDADRAFFSRESCRELFKWHVRTILTRNNTFTGVTYSTTPNVFGWNLMNEPRCRGCDDALQDWIDDMAAYVKAFDSNHMLTVGEEGFYAHDSSSEGGAAANPAAWAATTGQDFIRNHASKHIDFATIHVWRDNWAVYSPNVRFNAQRFTRNWIATHERDCRTKLRKPLLIEEFGAAPGGVRALSRVSRGVSRTASFLEERDVEDYYRALLSQVYRSIASDDGKFVRGALFWGMFPEDHRGVVDAYDPYAVYPSDGAFAQATRFAKSVRRVVRSMSCEEDGRD